MTKAHNENTTREIRKCSLMTRKEVVLATTQTRRALNTNCCLSRGLSVGFALLLATVCLGEEYLCIDVSGGNGAQEFPVSKIDKMPDGGWGDEYKTDKIVMRKIQDGDKTFYIGVFEITQRQWELVTGTRPSYYKDDSCYAKRPVEKVSYDDIRGKIKGSEYPKSSKVDKDSFIGVLRSKSKLDGLDLPTCKQWEIAYGEGVDSVVVADRGRFCVNCGFYLMPPPITRDCVSSNGTAMVGSYKPNDQGLYDMDGNVTEWCLDACYLDDVNRIKSGCSQDEIWPFGVTRTLKGGNCELGSCCLFHLGCQHYKDRQCGAKRLEMIGKYCSRGGVYCKPASLNDINVGLRIVVVF